VDFSPSGIRKRWEAGYEKTRREIDRAPWKESSIRSMGSFYTSWRRS